MSTKKKTSKKDPNKATIKIKMKGSQEKTFHCSKKVVNIVGIIGSFMVGILVGAGIATIKS